jgi:K+-sensing histidine kinase KdpD
MTRSMNIFFLVSLFYTLAALVFWENSLQKQNNIMFQKNIEINTLKNYSPSVAAEQFAIIKDKYLRKKKQYLGEGIVFLLAILIGAIIVYISFKRKLQLSNLQNNFMLSVTHELKSPLAGIKVGLETMAKRDLTKDQQHLMIRNSITEADRLNELCNNILLSTQIESKEYTTNKVTFNLIAVAEKCVEDFRARYQNIQWNFTSNINAYDYIGDEFLWRITLNNLLENAYKYAGNSAKIEMQIQQNNNRIKISIADQGPGIPDEDKKKIFHKFYRRGNENTRISKGTGLGLYIVDQTTKWHNASVKMEDNKPTGNIAIISIPT